MQGYYESTNGLGVKGSTAVSEAISMNTNNWFITSYDSDFGAQGSAVQQTSDEGYIVAGNTNSYGTHGNDLYLLKTDVSGDSVWAKLFGGSGNDVARSVLQTADGGYLISGFTWSLGEGKSDVYLIKTDTHGNEILIKIYVFIIL